MKKERSSNFELMRIVSMFFIVLFHMIIGTGGSLVNNTVGLTQILLQFICMIIIVHVNSFVLVSGYFQYDKKFSLKKILNLVGMAYFYKVVIAIIMALFNLHSFSILEIIKVLSPFEFQNNWFLIVYISMYIMSPYLNILIEKLSQKEHRKFILILFLIFTIIPTITNQNTFENTGFSLIHFMYMYIVGAYLKKYPISKNSHFINFSNNKKRFIFLAAFLFLGTFNFLMHQFSIQILRTTESNTLNYIANAIISNLYYYQNPILVIQSICYFLFFETFDFKNKFINKIASLVFAVYIIHENPFVAKHIYVLLGINTGGMIYDNKIIIRMFVATIIVMLVCLFIELIRTEILKLIKSIFVKIKCKKSSKNKIKTISTVNKKI